jgi:hypothetical protein
MAGVPSDPTSTKSASPSKSLSPNATTALAVVFFLLFMIAACLGISLTHESAYSCDSSGECSVR